jgi:hypothetical protein
LKKVAVAVTSCEGANGLKKLRAVVLEVET